MKTARLIWAGIFLVGVAMLATALFYQYVMDTAPCVLCVHARLWVAGLVVLSAIGFSTSSKLVLQPVLAIVALGFAVGLGETSYGLLSTERGWEIGSCTFDAGLPAWFALDEWLPAVFMPLEPCGYTPELLFGVTMAEGLMGISILVGVLCFLRLAASLRDLIVRSRQAAQDW
jgi:disulfide bond formation protein DsbB